MVKRFVKRIKNIKRDSLFIATVWIFIIGTIIIFFAISNHFYLVNLSHDTSKSIISTLIATAGSFIGFFVIYLTISFENFKKNYGQYALELFRKDQIVWSLGYLFIIIIIVGLTTFIFSDSKNFTSRYLFNLTCFYFLLAVCFLFPFGKAIINKSSSTEFLKRLVDELNEHDFDYKEPKNHQLKSVFQIVNKNEKNKVSIVSDILFYNISANNTKNSIQIIINLFDRIQKIINFDNLDVEKRRQIVFSFLDIIQTSFDLYLSKKDFIGIQTNLAALNSCNEVIAIKKYDRRFTKRAFETIEYITQSLIESEWEKLLSESLWVYYHMSADQLRNNMPNEEETWVEDEDFGALTLNTKIAEENDRKFEILSEFISFKFNAVIERSFLSKNYYLVEECVRMLGIFTEMVVFNENMGQLQKMRIGSSLAYSSGEAIKRFVTANYPKQHSYLNLFMPIIFSIMLFCVP